MILHCLGGGLLGLTLALGAGDAGAESTRPAAGLGGKPGAVELPALRTQSSKTFANPDGTRTWSALAGNVHYKDGSGQWDEIDVGIRPLCAAERAEVMWPASGDASDAESVPSNCPFAYGMTKNAYRSYFAADASSPILAKFATGNWSVSFGIEGARRGSVTVDGNTITYHDVFPGTDLRFTTNAEELREEIILHSAPSRAEWAFPLHMQNVCMEPAADGRLLFVDVKSGESIWSMPKPYMYDQTGERSFRVNKTTTARGGQSVLTVQADRDWLQTPTRQYPVIVDPTYTAQPSTQDTTIFGAAPNDNNGAQVWLAMCSSAKTNWGLTQAFVAWDMSSAPTTGVLNASNSCRVTMTSYSSSVAGSPVVDCRLVSTSWTEALTYNTSPQPTVGSAVATQTVAATNTAYVWSWNGSTSGIPGNYGIRLGVPSGTSSQYAMLCSRENSTTTRRPKLEIDYTSYVTNVTSSKANGTYGVGEIIDISVEFSTAVTVTGSPYLLMETGATDRQAAYYSGTGSTTLVFRYTVASGDTSADLCYVGTSSLALNSGTIKDASNNNAVLTLPAPGATGSLSANKAIVIATTCVPPSAPTKAAATGVGTTTITWNWSNVASETGYEVWSAASGGTLLASPNADVTSWTETDLLPGTSYQRWVLAKGSGCDSARTALDATSTTSRACPENGTFEGSFTSGVAAGWTKYTYSGSGVTCTADTSLFHGGAKAQRIAGSGSGDGGVYQIVNVTAGKSYVAKVWVRAVTGNGNAQMGVHPTGGTSVTSGSVVWGDAASVITTWQQISTSFQAGAASSYATAFFWTDSGTVWDDFTVEPLAPTTSGGATAICSGSSTNITASGGYGGASPGSELKWYTAADGGGTLAGSGSPLSVSPTTTTTYYPRYEVAGMCTASADGPSVTVAISGSPSAPTKAAATGVETDSITWNWSNVSNETGYEVWSASFGGTKLATLGADVTSWTESSLDPGTSYTRWVLATGCTNSGRTALDATSTAVRNCPENGDFEGGFTGGVGNHWIKSGSSGTWSQETVIKRDGTSSQEIYDAAGGDGYTSPIYQKLNVQPNRGYTVTVYSYRAVDGGAVMKLGINYTGGATEDVAYTTSTGGGWVAKTVSFTSGATGMVTILIAGGFNGNDSTVYVDGVDFVPQAPTTSGSTAICAGSNASLYASGGYGGNAIELKWYTGPGGTGTHVGNGSPLSVSPASTTTYYARWEPVSCSGSCCVSADGTPLTVTVNPLPAVPSPSANPAVVCGGSGSTLSANVGGGETADWYIGSCMGTYIGSGTSMAVSPNSTTTYYVRARNTSTNCYSACGTVTVTVNQPPSTAPGVSPASATICSGETVQVTVSGSEAGVSYQLYAGANPTGSAATGNGAALVLTSGALSSSTTLTVKATRSPCAAATLSQSVAVTVNAPPATGLGVSPAAVAVCSGHAVEVTIGAAEPGVTYQLYNGASPSGNSAVGDGDDLVLTSAPLTAATTLTIKATRSPCGTVTLSNSTAVTLAAATAVTQDPADANVLEGATASFTVAASGAGTLGYQWQFYSSGDWADLSDGDGFSGANTDTLQIADADDTAAGYYRCVITGDCDSVNSEAAELTIAPKAVAWYSVKVHAGAGEFALAATPGAGTPLVEPRRGDLVIRVVFDKAVKALDGTLDAADVSVVDSDSNPVSVGSVVLMTPDGDGASQTLEVTVPEASANMQRLTLELPVGKFCRPSSDKAALLGTRTCTVRMLIGDVNQGGSVNTTDMSIVRTMVSDGVVVSQSTCVYDVNLSGAVTIVDMALVKSNVGNTVP